jgi:hypothetical protein
MVREPLLGANAAVSMAAISHGLVPGGPWSHVFLGGTQFHWNQLPTGRTARHGSRPRGWLALGSGRSHERRGYDPSLPGTLALPQGQDYGRL